MFSVKAQRPVGLAKGELYLDTEGEVLQLSPEGAFSFPFPFSFFSFPFSLFFFFFLFSSTLHFWLDFSDFLTSSSLSQA